MPASRRSRAPPAARRSPRSPSPPPLHALDHRARHLPRRGLRMPLPPHRRHLLRERRVPPALPRARNLRQHVPRVVHALRPGLHRVAVQFVHLLLRSLGLPLVGHRRLRRRHPIPPRLPFHVRGHLPFPPLNLLIPRPHPQPVPDPHFLHLRPIPLLVPVGHRVRHGPVHVLPLVRPLLLDHLRPDVRRRRARVRTRPLLQHPQQRLPQLPLDVDPQVRPPLVAHDGTSTPSAAAIRRTASSTASSPLSLPAFRSTFTRFAFGGFNGSRFPPFSVLGPSHGLTTSRSLFRATTSTALLPPAL